MEMLVNIAATEYYFAYCVIAMIAMQDMKNSILSLQYLLTFPIFESNHY